MTVKQRLLQLERKTGRHYEPEDCPGGTTCMIDDGAPVPLDALLCELCGVPHVLIITEVIVDPEGPGLPREPPPHTI